MVGLDDLPTYFQTWSALQSHIRKSHPPICPHSSCTGRAFSNQGNLRAHLKLHEERDVEAELQNEEGCGDGADEPPKKRRRGGELGREWKCDSGNCNKEFKSVRSI